MLSDIIIASNQALANSKSQLIKEFEQEKNKNKSTISLVYDSAHKVDRVWNKSTGKKDFYPKHKIDGKWLNGLGDRCAWFPYGFDSLLPADGEYCLWHEGEKAAAYAINSGFPSISLVGSGAADDEIITNAVLMAKGLDYGGAVYIMDNDDAAIKKAIKVQQIALKNDFIVLALPIKQLFPQAQKGDDFVEYLKSDERYLESIKADIEIEIEDCCDVLYQAYSTCDKEVESVAVKSSSQIVQEDSLKEALEKYVDEENAWEKLQLKMEICGRHHLRRDYFKEAVEAVKQESKTSKQTVFSFTEGMNKEQIAEKWLMPSFLPQGEMLLLAAAPKVGKSLLCSDIAYAVLSGETFLGEETKKGKVLYVSSDESINTLARRFMSRGFDLLPEAIDNLRIMTEFHISNFTKLKEELETFKPDLVIIDSLTSISTGSLVSENDAAFADPIYKLKDLLAEYNASSVLVHHENKNSLAKGQNKVAGSSRITAAVWGIAQLSGSGESSADMGSNNVAQRILSLQPREGEFTSYKLNMNVKPTWSEKGIFRFVCETTDPNGQQKSQGDQVIALLKQGVPLEYCEIQSYLNFGQSLSKVLQRLSNKRLICRRRSQNNPRRWVYFIDSDSQEEKSTPPTHRDPNFWSKKHTQSIDIKEFDKEWTSSGQSTQTDTPCQGHVSYLSTTQTPCVANDLANEGTNISNSPIGGAPPIISKNTEVISSCKDEPVVENGVFVEGQEWVVQLPNQKIVNVYLVKDDKGELKATKNFELFFDLTELTFVKLVDEGSSNE